MEVTFQQPVQGTYIRIKTDNGHHYNIAVTVSTTNCKLAVLEGIVGNFGGLTEDERKEVMKQMMPLLTPRNLLITVNDRKLWEWFKDNYTHYYANVVPIGYGTGDQHHILIKNNNDERQPIKTIEVNAVAAVKPAEPVEKTYTKEHVLKVVNEAFDTVISRKRRIEIISGELSK